MSDERRERGDRQAAKTTIVGGQPPGNEREVDADTVPTGIESLLAMAAVDVSFAEALYEQRAEAIAASGVTLSPAEQQILAAVEQPVLRQMVANVGDAIPEPDRRAFLGRSAAALLAISSGALGIGTGGCKEPAMPVTGVKPDRPPKVDTAGVRPQTPPPKAPPDAAPPDAPPEPDAAPDVGAKKKPATKSIRRRTRGIRPDRPRSRGKRIERTAGIRPHFDNDSLNPFDKDD